MVEAQRHKRKGAVHFMPRFALLRHETPEHSQIPSHWDLMIERDGTLATWRLCQLPYAWHNALAETSAQLGADANAASTDPIAAIQLPEHRIAYLDYEGPLTQERGSVLRCDQGECCWILDAAGVCSVMLRGEKLRGLVELRRATDDDDSAAWLLCADGNAADSPGHRATAD
ncbi:MAG: hypothetical protein AAF961_01600 [Planctomycetota bacterium]